MSDHRLGNVIRVGFTEAHGMAAELTCFPPPGVQDSFIKRQPPVTFTLIRSPIKRGAAEIRTMALRLHCRARRTELTRGVEGYSYEELAKALGKSTPEEACKGRGVLGKASHPSSTPRVIPQGPASAAPCRQWGHRGAVRRKQRRLRRVPSRHRRPAPLAGNNQYRQRTA